MTAKANGFLVVEACDAMDAADRILEGGAPDIVLIDIGLSNVDGYELARLVRMNPATKAVPILLMTSGEGGYDAARATTAGVTATVQKPLDPTVLIETLRSHCPALPTATTDTPLPKRDA
jgi:twitching motility two-component system response regulator PilG